MVNENVECEMKKFFCVELAFALQNFSCRAYFIWVYFLRSGMAWGGGLLDYT